MTRRTMRPPRFSRTTLVVFGLALLAGAYYTGFRRGRSPASQEESAGLLTQPTEASIHEGHGESTTPLEPDMSEMADMAERRLTMSPADAKLAEIATAPVERKFVDAEVRMVGKVDYDETLLKDISAWVSGRVDRPYVDFTGVSVNKGDHLVWLYSPDLLTAQEELIGAKRRVDQAAPERSEFLRKSDLRSLESSREKLRLWGLGEDQVRDIEERGTAEDHVLINSPISGIVIHKALTEGQYVTTGTHIYTVADLSKVWVKLDAYESDLSWLRYSHHVVLAM